MSATIFVLLYFLSYLTFYSIFTIIILDNKYIRTTSSYYAISPFSHRNRPKILPFPNHKLAILIMITRHVNKTMRVILPEIKSPVCIHGLILDRTFLFLLWIVNSTLFRQFQSSCTGRRPFSICGNRVLVHPSQRKG